MTPTEHQQLIQEVTEEPRTSKALQASLPQFRKQSNGENDGPTNCCHGDNSAYPAKLVVCTNPKVLRIQREAPPRHLDYTTEPTASLLQSDLPGPLEQLLKPKLRVSRELPEPGAKTSS
ncbi:hypothetical protein ATANTOWER_031949 [Ataeniobius toweri]|uniref:Uncharacterized protein n=1 Tax=Ataeniobius toweri TaxID=208326 RepID=A0ABU7B4E3_9TELE|nr:hypothetical protein [Ataeniobius toweri]